MARVAVDGQATESINTLVSSLRMARSEAIVSYQDPVVVCPSADGEACNSTNWSDGWIVFVDDNRNGVNDGNDRLVRVAVDLPDRLQIRAVGLNNNRLIFDSEGMLNAAGAFTICDDRGDAAARAVIINASGQTRLGTDDNADGIVNTHLGNVACNV